MIKISNLNKYFNKNKNNEIHVINNSSIEFPETGLVTIYGESGCGKTTLLNVLGGLDDFHSGIIEIDDLKVKKYSSKKIDRVRNEKIGYIFQNYLLLQQRTVYENLKIVLDMYNLSNEDIDKRINYVLSAVGMMKYKKKNVSELSGGQQQRVSIARALIKSPSLILADEPTGNLDEKNTIEIMNILKKISKNTLVILVSHEQNIVNSYSDYLIQIKDGTIVSQKNIVDGEKYFYTDDQNIYLKDFEYKNIENDNVNIEFFSNENKTISLKIIYQNNRFYISSNENIVLLDDSSEIKLIDDHKKVIDTTAEIDNNTYELEKLEYVKNPSLSFKDIILLAKENLRNLRKRTLMLTIPLFIISILVMLSIHSLITASHVDYQGLANTHSDIYNISLEKADIQTTYLDEKLGFGKFYNKFINDNPNIEIVIDENCSMTYTINSFSQLRSETFNINGFSLLTTEQLPQTKLYYGRYPKNSTEIVVEKWVLENALKGSTLNNFMTVKSFLNEKVKIEKTNFNFTIVGIADNDNHAIYLNKWHAFDVLPNWFYSSKISIGSLNELSKYMDTSNLSLSDDECYLSINKKGQAVDNVFYINNSSFYFNGPSYSYNIKEITSLGEAPFDIIVNDNQYYKLLELVLINNYNELNVLCHNQEEREQVDKYIESVYDEFKNGSLLTYENKPIKIELTCESKYDELINPYILESNQKVKSRILITICILLISIFIVFFSMKSYAIKNIYDIGVYRAIGVKKSSVVMIYALETLILSFKTTLIGGLLCYIITNIIDSIPVIETNIGISTGMFIITTIALIILNIIIGILPITNYLRLTPSKILTKTDA